MTVDHRERKTYRGGSKRPSKPTVRRRPKEQQGSSSGKQDRASGKDSQKVWRANKKESRSEIAPEDKILLAAASARIGPGGYKRFSDIPAHKLGRKLRVKLYELAKRFPDDERNNLVARVKSESTTMTAALVTGFGQGTFRSAIAGALESRGALFGMQDLLDQAQEHQFIDGEQRQELRGELDDVIDALNSYLGELVRDRDRLTH